MYHRGAPRPPCRMPRTMRGPCAAFRGGVRPAPNQPGCTKGDSVRHWCSPRRPSKQGGGSVAAIGVVPTRRLGLLAAFALAVLALLIPLAAAQVAQAADEPTPPAAFAPPSLESRSLTLQPRVRLRTLCYAPLVGDWRNVDTHTRAMTRVIVDHHC